MNKSKLSAEIIEKYNVSSPRYTSYPTILDWNQDTIDLIHFKSSLLESFQNKTNNTASVYIHLPFCESLCTFCGCHKHITKNHTVEEPYINALIQEWDIYQRLIGQEITIEELHLGGGTPTFFSSKQLKRLVHHITKNRTQTINFSFEGHPNHTSLEQLKTLYDAGFRRVSFGVQDYDPNVQKAINRIQSYEQVKKVTEDARELGYESISHDLVFGLPKQTIQAIHDSIKKTIFLKPDNISLYSYAHVPWVKGTGQRGFSESDLPSGSEKKALYEHAKDEFLKAGYLEIGMDHFGLPTEPMTIAMQNQELNRNFMGYTTAKSDRLIGLGVSAISEYPFGYAQNVKSVKAYYEAMNKMELPIFRGHFHSALDSELKVHIKELMCNFKTHYSENSWIEKHSAEFKEQLNTFQNDGILEWKKGEITITKEGRPFVRNVCMMLDPYTKNENVQHRFSKSV